MNRADRISGRPGPGEFAPYAGEDVEAVAGDDAIAAMRRARASTLALFRRFGEAGGGLTYAPGKWSVKQVLGHLADDERIFAYRALCIARGDSTPLPGFDEKVYALNARAQDLSLAHLVADYEAVRAASIALFRGLDQKAWLRRGVVNGYPATPRGLAFHIVGHELHHHRILEQRYLPLASG